MCEPINDVIERFKRNQTKKTLMSEWTKYPPKIICISQQALNHVYMYVYEFFLYSHSITLKYKNNQFK